MKSASLQLAILATVMAVVTWQSHRGGDARSDVVLMAVCTVGLVVASAAALALA